MPRYLASLLTAALMSACAPSPAADNDALRAVATTFPLAWVAAEIAPEAQLTHLAAHGRDPHDLELSPTQRTELTQADVVVHVGDVGFQPHVERAIADSDAHVVAAASVNEERLRRTDEGIDPHVWFDARIMADVALAVGEAFAAADPAQAESYRTRASGVHDRLQALAAEIDAMLDDCEHDKVVVGHEAFGYLLEPHGITQEGVSGAGGHGEASPARIRELVDEIRRGRLPAVLSEPVEGRQEAEAVAREAGVPIVEILSLDIVPADAEADYPDLLRAQARAVAEAARCA